MSEAEIRERREGRGMLDSYNLVGNREIKSMDDDIGKLLDLLSSERKAREEAEAANDYLLAAKELNPELIKGAVRLAERQKSRITALEGALQKIYKDYYALGEPLSSATFYEIERILEDGKQ